MDLAMWGDGATVLVEQLATWTQFQLNSWIVQKQFMNDNMLAADRLGPRRQNV